MRIIDRVAGWFGYQKRAHPSAEPNALMRSIFGISEAYSGIEVSSENAMEVGAFACGTSRIADDIAGLPRKVYRKMPDGSCERVTDHPVAKLLSEEEGPCSWMTGFNWIETGLRHFLLESNWYSRIYRNKADVVVAIVLLDPKNVKPIFRTAPDEILPELWYEVTDGAGKEIVHSRDILHVRTLSWDGITGRSRVKMAKEDLGLSLAIQRYGATFFRRPVPPVALEFPEELKDEEFKRIAQDWADRYGGLDNAHKPAFLEAGAKVHSLGVNPDDAQANEASQQAVTNIARVLKMPPHLVGDLLRATFSNIEHQRIEYTGGTLVPITNNVQSEFKRKLFSASERAAGLYMEFDYAGLLRGDLKTRYEAYQIGRNGGWLSANDVRRKENENPIPGGDEYMKPLNMTEAGKGSDKESDDEEVKPDEAKRALRAA